MATAPPRPPREALGFERSAAVLEQALVGATRGAIVDHALGARDFAGALKRLRAGLRAHRLERAGGALDLRALVQALDAASRQDGFHVLLEWEQAAGRFSREEIPVLMADQLARGDASTRQDRDALATLLDFYFLYLIALLLMRVWDEGDPGANLDRVDALLAALRGPDGSGQRMVDGVGTLLFVATSNFQPDDTGYRRLLDRVRALDDPHRVRIAMGAAPVVGTHLRWALSAIYERDVGYMRRDNAVDYPWLFFGVATLMREYARLRAAGAGDDARAAVVGALLNGLSADPWAFVGRTPEPLADYADEHAEFRALFERHRAELIPEFEARIPPRDAYSPLSLQFNFPHNTLVGRVVLGLIGAAPNLPFDALLAPSSADADEVLVLARALTGYAAAHPERRGERRVLPVAFNESIGLRSFSWTMSTLKRAGAAPK